MRVIMAALAGLLLTGAAEAPSEPRQSADFCRVQSEAITAAVKEMGYRTAAAVFMRDAVRRSISQGEIANLHAGIQNRLIIMNGRDCPPYDGPLSEQAYGSAAIPCVSAQRNGDALLDGRRVTEEVACDRSSWQPDPEVY